MNDEDVIERLDTIITLLSLEKREMLQAELEELDDAHIDILRQTETWTEPSEFKDELAEEHEVSTRTIENKVADLVDSALLNSKGNAPATEYKRASVFNQLPSLKSVLE